MVAESAGEPSGVVANANVRARSDERFRDERDLTAAERGFLGTLDPLVIRAADGREVWNAESFRFLAADPPESVHPSLWRQARLITRHGLFEIVPGIYQVRGFDISNITFIEGASGVIVVDPLISEETAAAAIALYRSHRGERPVVAVIITHSHVDHFGGIGGVTTAADVASGAVQIIAPTGLVDQAVSEAVFAGVAMARRSGYMYGASLPRGPRGQVTAGLGPTTSVGTIGLMRPSREIRDTEETIRVDGVEIEFQLTPGTEAPAEMHFYLPAWRALCVAENATHTMHNLVTLRGAQVRDAHAWAHYLSEAIERYADRTDVAFASHHWPTWGSDEIREFLELQRDLYAYLHDQTVRLMNRGLTGTEVAEGFTLPPALESAWHARGYYGSVSHNVKAVYQRYMGWFDGNPANLWPHPPQELAERYVAAIGGVERVRTLAAEAAAAGDYRWAATLLSHAVFAEPDDPGVRSEYAAVLEQLGYGSENATWRNVFLSGAAELREGSFGTPTGTDTTGMMAQLTPDMLFDSLAVRVNGPKAWPLHLRIVFAFQDSHHAFALTLRNGVLTHREHDPSALPDADLTVRLTSAQLLGVLGAGRLDDVVVEGDASALATLAGILDPGDPAFEIVLPRRGRVGQETPLG